MFVVAWLGCLAAFADAPEGFTPLFDGKTLTGWEGNEKMFRIEDGAIVGGNRKRFRTTSSSAPPRNTRTSNSA
jgi:hypothetical protein